MQIKTLLFFHRFHLPTSPSVYSPSSWHPAALQPSPCFLLQWALHCVWELAHRWAEVRANSHFISLRLTFNHPRRVCKASGSAARWKYFQSRTRGNRSVGVFPVEVLCSSQAAALLAEAASNASAFPLSSAPTEKQMLFPPPASHTFSLTFHTNPGGLKFDRDQVSRRLSCRAPLF